MKVVLTGGGTGGHVNPALAIADIIKKKDKNAEIIYIGTKRGIENKLVAKEGYPMYHVEARGFNRKMPVSPKNILAAYYYFASPVKAKKIMEKFKPDVVIGTGGYVCYAPLLAASRLGIPTLVHESNAYPGLAVRMLEKNIDRILLNFEKSADYITEKEKIRIVGNPLRDGFSVYDRKKAREELGIDEKAFVILSYGGSLGAPCINEAVLGYMKRFADNPEVICVHSTGNARYDEFIKRFEAEKLKNGGNLQISNYIYDMPKKLAAADLVISRAGAMTVTEMAKMRKPCVMIPSSHVTDNHQYKNAKALEDEGAVVLIEEKDLTSEKLANVVEKLKNDVKKRSEMSKNIAKFAKDDVSGIIYGEIEKLTK